MNPATPEEMNALESYMRLNGRVMLLPHHEGKRRRPQVVVEMDGTQVRMGRVRRWGYRCWAVSIDPGFRFASVPHLHTISWGLRQPRVDALLTLLRNRFLAACGVAWDTRGPEVFMLPLRKNASHLVGQAPAAVIPVPKKKP